MARKLIMLLVTLVLLINSSCSRINDSFSNIKTLDTISKELLRLGELNQDWLISRDGWIQVVSHPSEEGIIKFTFQERWTHYKLNHDECIEEMLIIRRTENSEDSQFWLHTSEGFETEMLRLRNQIYFSNPSIKKQITQEKCLVSDRSAPLIVLAMIKENHDFIVSAEMTELSINMSALVFIIHFRGSDINMLGIPDNAIGKKETYYFDKETGNQLLMELELEYLEGDWMGKTSIENEISFYFSLPQAAQLKLESAVKELEYYRE